MRVAVAGGGGFIGGHLCEALEVCGHDVQCFGSEGAGSIGGTVDSLVWLGGRTSIRDREELLHRCHVADAMRSLVALAPRHVIYVSSGEVYGRGRVPFAEGDMPAPLTGYAKAKLAGERAVSLWCAHSAVPLTVLRPAVVYGPRQTGCMLIPTALRALASGSRFPTTEGLQTRDFVSVHDVVELMTICLGARAHGIFNVGSGRECKVRDVLLVLARCVGADAERLLEFGARKTRPGEAKRYVLDIAAAEQLLDWRPTTGLAAGLAEVVECHALRG